MYNVVRRFFMKNSNKFLFLSALVALSMTACANREPVQSSSDSEPASTQSSIDSSEQQSSSESSSEPVSSSVESSEPESVSSASIAPQPYYDDTVSVFVLSDNSAAIC